MDFDFNDDQEMLRDTVRRWVERGYDFERRRGIVKAGGFARDAWQEIADLGIVGLQVPEAHGGLGLGPVDAMVVMEELGRGLVLEPYAAVALVATTLLKASAEPAAADRLQAIAEGRQIVVLAQEERGSRYRLDHIETAATTRAGTGWALSGTKIAVPAGAAADAFVVSARVRAGSSTGVALFLVAKDAPGVSVNAYPMQDGSSGADLVLTGAEATLLLDAGTAMPALELAVDTGIAALCAEAVGAMDKLVAITVEYMNTRKQFGVAIASFQALRHRIADVKMQLELARSMSYYATLKLGEPPEARRRALAQARCSSATRCATSASSASSCTAASASPTSTRRATTSSG